jgi:hypothetical protein
MDEESPIVLDLSEAAADPGGFAEFVRCEAFSGVGGLDLHFASSGQATSKHSRNRQPPAHSVACPSTRLRWAKPA